MHDLPLCDWFGSSASASDSQTDNLVFTRSKAERKRFGTLFLLDRKLHAFDYDSDSVANEKQP